MSILFERVEAAPALPINEYYWYRLKVPITLSLHGKEVKLERGEQVGIRPSQSNPAKFRIVTDSLPITTVFTVDINSFKKLGKYMVGISRERLKRIGKKTSPVSIMTAKFNVQRFVDSFESIQDLISYVDEKLYYGLLDISAEGLQQAQRETILQFRKMFQLTSSSKRVTLYKVTKIKQPTMKYPQPGMAVMFKPLLTSKGGFHTWYLTSKDAEHNNHASASFLLEAHVPTKFIVWCRAMCVAIKQATSSLMSAAKKKWGTLGPEDEKNLLKEAWENLIYEAGVKKEVILDALAMKGGFKCQILEYSGDDD